MLNAKVPADYLQDAAPAITAACSHQPALLELVAANLVMGNLEPHPFVCFVSESLLQSSALSHRGDKGSVRVAHIVTRAILQSLTDEQQIALIKLAVLPISFSLEAASVASFHFMSNFILEKKLYLREGVPFTSAYRYNLQSLYIPRIFLKPDMYKWSKKFPQVHTEPYNDSLQ